MIKIINTVLIFLVIISAAPVLAAPEIQTISGDEGLAEMLQQIRQSQNLAENQAIDCDQVSDERFKGLGEAVMGLMHPDPEQHELMDQMMGGEGSDNLAYMHTIMGQRYLGCLGGDNDFGMMGGMGGMMTGNGANSFSMMNDNWQLNKSKLAGDRTGGDYMMGYLGNWGGLGLGLGWFFMIIFWGLIILAAVALIRWLANQGKGQSNDKSALAILKERYAKGEIDKKEFEEKKKDLA